MLVRRTLLGIFLATHLLTSEAQAQLTPIPPFAGDQVEGFESHSSSGLTVCIQGGILGGSGTLCTLGTPCGVTGAAFGGGSCTVSPQSGSRFANLISGTWVLTLPQPQRRVGAWFASTNETPNVSIDVYDGAGQLLGSDVAMTGGPCGWGWAGWESGQADIARLEIEGLHPGSLAGVGLDELHISTQGSTCTWTSYCTGKANSLGCVPKISADPGCPSTPGFKVRVTQLLNQRPAILFHGSAPNALPFQGGFLCVQPPIQRTAVQSTAGNPPPADCSGTLVVELATLGLTAGPTYIQAWSRDPASPSTTSLSNGLRLP